MPSSNSSTQKTNNHSTNKTQLDYLKTTPIVCSSSKTANSLVSSHTNTTSTSSASVVSCTPKAKNNIVNNSVLAKTLNNPSIPSIWDLPVTTNNLDNTKVMIAGKKSNSKKKKKNREVSLFPAKEELAHWCESQLSSIPLSGVDLPTLVDLLCELQATDEIVEFIESSLGRSKRISQFSRDFLQKRALFRE
uniref:SJCHGC09490 protein n=1 Tax=Schistosoma japonicum TaxID=6182 RepID=Q5DAW6_SCHJA|nr:SJCHGC09490 protein [Schistosoma japonicum]